MRLDLQEALQDIRYTSDEAARLGLSEVKAHRSELIGANATSHERSAFAVSDARSLTLKEILKGMPRDSNKDNNNSGGGKDGKDGAKQGGGSNRSNKNKNKNGYTPLKAIKYLSGQMRRLDRQGDPLTWATVQRMLADEFATRAVGSRTVRRAK